MILFVCRGNVARSQFAEALARESGVSDVKSAGADVPVSRRGRRLCEDGSAASKAAAFFLDITGIDISGNKRKQLTRETVDSANRIILMTEPRYLPADIVLPVDRTERWDIPDPHDMDIEGYRRVIEEIRRRVEALTGRKRPG